MLFSLVIFWDFLSLDEPCFRYDNAFFFTKMGTMIAF
jgi:hypothetical protein